MKVSEELKIKKTAAVKRMQEILNGAKKENKRSLNEAEQAEWDKLDGQVTGFDAEIKRSLRMEELEPVIAPVTEPVTTGVQRSAPVSVNIKREAAPYSVGKAIREWYRGGEERLTGREAEAHKELSRGVSSQGLLVPFGRANSTTTTNASSIDVGIDPNLSIIGKDSLYTQMGLTTLPGLQGSIKLGKKTADISGKYGEEAPITGTPSAPSYVTLSPKRYGITDILSKELLAQENPAVQAAIVADMIASADREISAEAYAVALAAATETTGGAITVDGFNKLMQAVDTDGAFAMDRASFFEAKGVKVDTGSGRFLTTQGMINGVGKTYDGVNAFYSTLFADGTDQQYVIYGAWKEIYLGLWGALEILINPYTYQKNGQIELTVNKLADLKCRNSAAFVKSPDLLTV